MDEIGGGYVDLGIFLLLPEEINTQTTKLRNYFNSKGLLTDKYSLESLPHITLFQGRYPTSILDSLGTILGEIEVPNNLTTDFEGPLYNYANQNIFWNTKKTPELVTLHKTSCDLLVPKTEGMIMDQFRNYANSDNSTLRHKELIQQYGVHLVEENFIPHITIGNMKRGLGGDDLIPGDLDLDFSVRPTTVAFGELGLMGDIKQVVERRSLDINLRKRNLDISP